jgi:nucleotide-binding universal stress UspA family protein
MLRSILIGLDGSNDGEAAVELGLSWAKAHNATAVGISIVDESGILVSEQAIFATGYNGPIAEPLLDAARHRSRVILEKFTGRCHELHVHCKALSESGTPYIQVLEEAQVCDLVVLGQRTLSRVLKDSPRPLVSVPKSPKLGADVVVAYDGSLQASRALYAFEASGLARSRTVHVVSAATIGVESARHANRAVEFLRNHDIKAVDHAMESHLGPAESILEEVRRHDTGLLVMGAYGKPTLREFFIGSVTRSVLERSEVPVF